MTKGLWVDIFKGHELKQLGQCSKSQLSEQRCFTWVSCLGFCIFLSHRVYSLHSPCTIFGPITALFGWVLEKTFIVLCLRLYLTFQRASDLPNYRAFFPLAASRQHAEPQQENLRSPISFSVCVTAAHTGTKLSLPTPCLRHLNLTLSFNTWGK